MCVGFGSSTERERERERTTISATKVAMILHENDSFVTQFMIDFFYLTGWLWHPAELCHRLGNLFFGKFPNVSKDVAEIVILVNLELNENDFFSNFC